jgi:predicted phosphoribosyltransferase
MARIIADELGGELDIVLVRNLRAPGHRELAIGAVTESGPVQLTDHPFARDIPEEYLEQEREQALATLRRQRALFTPARAAVNPAGRIVIIVDDGIATGATVEAALRALQEKTPKLLIVATAVAPADTVENLNRKADDVVCLAQPDDFSAVSNFYLDFSEVTDNEVIAALRSTGLRRAG